MNVNTLKNIFKRMNSLNKLMDTLPLEIEHSIYKLARQPMIKNMATSVYYFHVWAYECRVQRYSLVRFRRISAFIKEFERLRAIIVSTKNGNSEVYWTRVLDIFYTTTTY